jgi:hypothetical protein
VVALLSEDQLRQILADCEKAVGHPLSDLREKLLKHERLSPTWELITIDAASDIGQVAYEVLGGGPDIRLTLPEGDRIWIEAVWHRGPKHAIELERDIQFLRERLSEEA